MNQSINQGLVGCDIMLLHWKFLMFQRIVAPSSSGSHSVPGLLTAEDEDNTIPCNTRTTHPTAQPHIPEDLIFSNAAVRTSTVMFYVMLPYQ
jgi:hypothetical protein